MITQDYMTISPAYGQDYKSGKAAIEDFKAGKDFIMQSMAAGRDCGSYCSVRDFAKGVVVNIRYAKMTKVAVAKAP